MNYWLRRFLSIIPITLGVVTLTFFMIHLIPGEPVDLILGDEATALEKDVIKKEFGLDQPLYVQYVDFLKNLVQLDLGRSLFSRREISEIIASRFPATLELSVAALLITLFIGIPLGVLSAIKKGTSTDFGLMVSSMIVLSWPGIFLAPLLIWIFSIKLNLFPVSERGGLEHLVLPALSLALPLGAVIMRVTRASVLNTLAEPFMRTAVSKGVSPSSLYFKHALRNALIPIVTIFGLQMGALLTGTVITETIFDWPGIGTLLLSGIQQRDYPLVQGCILFVSLIYVLINLLTDMSYGFINPHVKAGKKAP